MRKTSKFSRITTFMLAFLVAFAAILAPSTTASAADEGTLNIYKLSSKVSTDAEKAEGEAENKAYYTIAGKHYEFLKGAEYTIYKIGTLQQKEENNVVKVDYEPFTGLKDINGADITALDKNTEAGKINETTAQEIKKLITDGNGLVTTKLDENYVYLVKETKTPEGVNKSNDFIISVPMYIEDEGWTKTINAFPKNTVSDVEIAKYIIDEELNKVSELYAQVGDDINYQVEVKVPADIDSVNYTRFAVVDTPKHLLINTAKVKVALADNTELSSEAPADYTVSAGSDDKVTIEFTEAGIAKLTGGEIITITYQAKVLPTAASNKNGPATNNIQLLMDVDDEPLEPVIPNPDPDPDPDPGKDPDPDTKVYVYAYGIQKIGSTDQPLAGAIFKLTNEAGDYLEYDSSEAAWNVVTEDKATAFTTGDAEDTNLNGEAILQFWNLDEGETYYLVEIEAPSGYTVLVKPIPITASDDTTDVVYASYEKQNNGTYTYQPGELGVTGFSIRIKNLSDDDVTGQLPSTGGNGIYMFLIIGIALIAVATVLYGVSRKKDNVA